MAHTKGMEEGEVAQKAATKSSVAAGTKTRGKTPRGKAFTHFEGYGSLMFSQSTRWLIKAKADNFNKFGLFT